MSPESAPGQVQIREPELSFGAVQGRFSYRIVIHQEAVRHQFIRGALEASIQGDQDGEPASHMVAGPGTVPDGEWPPVKFRYFQEFTGSFALPEGFEPAKVSVEVTVTKPRKFEVREEFPWRIQEQSGDVGK